MGLVVTIPDPWNAANKKLASLVPTPNPSGGGAVLTNSARTPTVTSIRRPISGVSVKPNTPAYVQVIDSKGTILDVLNEMGRSDKSGVPMPDSKYWTDWSLQAVAESREEKIQVTETFGAAHFYAFGERPRFLQFSVVLVNTADFNWRAQFWENWDKYFRATRLVQMDAQLFISFDDILVNGYAINATAQQMSNDPHRITLSFSLFVVGYTNLSLTVSPTTAVGQPKVVLASTERRTTAGFAADEYASLSLQQRLGSILATQRVRFNESLKYLLDTPGVTLPSGTVISGKDILFSPFLRYIRGSQSAADVLLTHIHHEALTAAYKGTDSLVSKTVGGQPGLMFWFGAVNHLYKATILNVFNALPAASSSKVNSKLLEVLSNSPAAISGPYGVASKLGYSMVASLGTTLYQATGRWSQSNMTVDSSGRLIPLAGAREEVRLTSRSGFSVPTSSQTTSTNLQGAADSSAFFPEPSFSIKPAALRDASTDQKEEDAALIAQRDLIKKRYAAAIPLDSDEDIAEDGSEVT